MRHFNSYIPTRLGGIVDQIWEMEVPFAGNYSILPEGKVQLLFPLHFEINLSAKKITNSENPMRNCTSFLSGLHTKPLKMKFDRFHTFGVQMKPIAAKAIFSIPLCEIKDYFVEGDRVVDNIQIMENHLNSKANFMERAHWLENFLLRLINETPDLHQAIRLNQEIKNYIKQKSGSKKSIEDLMGYSRTQTFRLFQTWFGTSSHSYMKLLRFIRSVESLHNPAAKLGDVALDTGFYDQAHFIRTFREFADMTPGEYRKQMTELPGQLFT